MIVSYLWWTIYRRITVCFSLILGHSFWLCVGGVIDDNLPIPPTSFNRNSLDFNEWNWSWSNCLWSTYLSNAFDPHLPDNFITLSGMPYINWSVVNPFLIEMVPKRLRSKPTSEHSDQKLVISDPCRGWVHKRPNCCSEHDWHMSAEKIRVQDHRRACCL